MQDTIIIPERFRGPPNSGNGGYVGGAFARLVNHDCRIPTEVTLRSPIPLDHPLQINRSDSHLTTITDGEQLIAEVRTTEMSLHRPPVPELAAIEASASQSYSFTENLNPIFEGRKGFHPICFCCGAEHEDGARVFAAPVGDQVAAVWQTDPSWCDENNRVPLEYLWTAMDCPGQFAYLATGIRTGMLGRISAVIHEQPAAGEKLIVCAWPIEIQGKKHFAGSAIYSLDGQCFSEAITVWIGRRD